MGMVRMYILLPPKFEPEEDSLCDEYRSSVKSSSRFFCGVPLVPLVHRKDHACLFFRWIGYFVHQVTIDRDGSCQRPRNIKLGAIFRQK